MPRFTTRTRKAPSYAQGQGGGSSSSRRTIPAEPTGYYDRNEKRWYCNCVPRTLADIRTVSKDTKNKGRKFWTCSKDRRASCGFFLWDDDARVIEAESEAQIAAMTPSSTQRRLRQTQIVPTAPQTPTRSVSRQRLFTGNPAATAKRDSDSSDDDYDDDAASLSTDAEIDRDEALAAAAAKHSSGGNSTSQDSSHTLGRPNQSQSLLPLSKRKRDHVQDEEDFSDGFNDPDVVRGLVDLADHATSSIQRPVTPAKQRQGHAIGAARGGLPTPVSRNTLLIAPEGEARSSNKRVRLSTPNGISSPTSTPFSRENPFSSSRAATFSSLATLKSSHQQQDDSESYELTTQILALLDGQISQRLSADGKPTVLDLAALRSAIRRRLDAEVLKAKGAKMGQAAAWEGISKRDSQISALQEKIAALENERTVLKGQVADYKGRMEGFKRLLAED
ncbi:hypothetical protein MGG_09946 [Pyricularia oryzae 70-15]|nr:uncharacterized protein MGG_09946 [Pyricularia oryzae 70-15]EHA57438.1 hypothetical protein MGG_09946 [Pyricularia oryzae 70-15]ELQ42324.1 hypothetical protein OOU_Y34scaffold00215g8 [Pyricularia oryzae Y34]